MKLHGKPVGTRFLDTSLNAVYEIVEVPFDQYTELHGSLRGRAVDRLDTTAYVLGSWFDEEVEILS